MQQTGQAIRETILAAGRIPVQELDDVAAWCIEELVCDIFDWKYGDFEFIDGDQVHELCGHNVIETGQSRVQTTAVVMEAIRRQDEWKQIREIITDEHELYLIDNDGRTNLRNIDSDPEMLKVLRYLDGRHHINAISKQLGMPRFDVFAIVAHLIVNNVARPRSVEELLADALQLRSEGELGKAANLLESALQSSPMQDVQRPLAEISLEQGHTSRAIELLLDLVQRAQDDGDLEQALKDINTVLQVNPEDPDLYRDRGDILLDLWSIRTGSKSLCSSSRILLVSRDIKQAVDACHRAKDLNPASPEPHRLLAKAHLIDGSTDSAIIEYKSLWHALLSHNRPKRAVEILREIFKH